MQPRTKRLPIPGIRFDGWIITVIICAISVLLWLRINPLSSLFVGDFSSIMLAWGRLTGIVGMIMYALNLIYSTRLRFLEDLFGGLNRVYIAHHILGGLALILLCFHPLFLSLQYVSTSLRDAGFLLIPHDLVPISALFDTGSNFHADVLQQWAIFWGIVAFWGMVILLTITFFVKLPYQIWLFTHKFLGPAFFLAGLHVLFIRSDTSASALLKYYIMLITLLGIVAFVYRTLMPKILIRRYQYQVMGVNMQNSSVAKIIMQPRQAVMSYKPGQFVFIRFIKSGVKEITNEWHPFSISSTPGGGSLEITAKALGDFSGGLSKLSPGTVAEIEGAYGRFTYTNYKNLNQIWIAGGIGITPFLSMAKSLPAGGYSIDLYYSVKSESELVEWQQLADIAMSRNGNFRLIPFVSDVQKGFLDTKFMLQYSKDFRGKEIFICGPPPMMKSIKGQLLKSGVDKKNIHSEEFAMS